MDCELKRIYLPYICLILFSLRYIASFTQNFPATDTYCKINQMKFSHADMLVSIHTLLTALDGNGEDGVRTGAMFIHVCGTNRP